MWRDQNYWQPSGKLGWIQLCMSGPWHRQTTTLRHYPRQKHRSIGRWTQSYAESTCHCCWGTESPSVGRFWQWRLSSTVPSGRRWSWQCPHLGLARIAAIALSDNTIAILTNRCKSIFVLRTKDWRTENNSLLTDKVQGSKVVDLEYSI